MLRVAPNAFFHTRLFMPDSRGHRGAHPEDARLFARDQWPALQRASAEMAWLLDRGYAMRSSLALVGNRHELTQRQRLAVARCACAAAQCERRRQHELPCRDVSGAELWIDGYNLLISIESALGGGVILGGRDGCYRDLASLHGTYREVSETLPALHLIGNVLVSWGVRRCRWLLDRPVSNSGRLRDRMLELASIRGWPWDVQLEFNPDQLLAECSAVVVSSDSVVLDRCAHWLNAARHIIDSRLPDAHIVPLNGDDKPIT
jgi:hypothetical protein